MPPPPARCLKTFSTKSTGDEPHHDLNAAELKEVRKRLYGSGRLAVVVTKNGQPEGVFLATSAETWLEDVQDVVFARARRATQQMRRAAAQSGAAEMNREEIIAEIQADRAERKQ